MIERRAPVLRPAYLAESRPPVRYAAHTIRVAKINCPRCAGPMVEGSLAPTRSDPISDAIAPERFVFRSLQTGKPIDVLPAQAHQAACCPRCGTLLVLGTGMRREAAEKIATAYLDAFKCLACGTEIPAASATCPACGWSYLEKASE